MGGIPSLINGALPATQLIEQLLGSRAGVVDQEGAQELPDARHQCGDRAFPELPGFVHRLQLKAAVGRLQDAERQSGLTRTAQWRRNGPALSPRQNSGAPDRAGARAAGRLDPAGGHRLDSAGCRAPPEVDNAGARMRAAKRRAGTGWPSAASPWSGPAGRAGSGGRAVGESNRPCAGRQGDRAALKK